MQSKYIASFLLLAIIVTAGCNISSKSQETNPNQCYGDIKNYVKENPRLNLDSEINKYCGSGKINNVEIIADSIGYKSEITINYENNQFKRVYYPELIDAMEWLKQNTDKNAKIMTWWDYGGMINVFSERIPVALSPSKESLKFVGDYFVSKSLSNYPKLEDDQKIKKIALVLTTNNPLEAVKIMNEFNTKYLFIPKEIAGKFPVIYEIAYGNAYEEDELDRESIIYKALNNQQISGFKKVYSDDNSVILELI